jgi:hypothetical protein
MLLRDRRTAQPADADDGLTSTAESGEYDGGESRKLKTEN